MNNTNDFQGIEKEYFEKQKNSQKMLCIYEEKGINTSDIEWFYDDISDEWCYFRIKKERYGSEWEEVVIQESKKIKTFGKKCHVTEMSFFNFMALKKFELFNCKSETVEGVNHYIEGYNKWKLEDEKTSIDDYNKYLKEKRNQEDKSLTSSLTRKSFYIGVITLILGIFLPVMLIISIIAFLTFLISFSIDVIKFNLGKK